MLAAIDDDSISRATQTTQHATGAVLDDLDTTTARAMSARVLILASDPFQGGLP